MSTPILATKLYIPPLRPRVVLRPRLVERLDEGLSSGRKLTLISASAGFGKTTLLSEWVSGMVEPSTLRPTKVAWLSLDEGDNDPARFLTYFVAALQTISASTAEGVLVALQSPRPPPTEAILTVLLNEITAIPDDFVFVLDDYHVIDAEPIDNALAFLLEHLPPQMHVVIATREDPRLPLARLRARSQLTELRAADLRFSPSEAAEFLNSVMGLDLSEGDIAALESRTEGWIAGLQLAAVSMQGQQDTTSFIRSFSGSHHFVLDYLLEEVLQQQSESIRTFLLRTSILERLCGPLCDAVVLDPSASGQQTLEHLDRSNLFIVPLDSERRWYRYHHLFAELLRQRLHQSAASGQEEGGVPEYHIRASQWFEDNGLEIEAFRHAAAANDIERAERLIEGTGIPLHLRGAAASVLNWLASLPKTALDARPSLWVRYARLLMVTGQATGVEEKLQAAEAAMKSAEQDEDTRDLVGRIAAVRANLAWIQYQVEATIAQSRRALNYLAPGDQYYRFTAVWSLGFARLLQGDRAAAGKAFTEALAISQASGDTHSTTVAMTGMGNVQEMADQLHPAADSYRRALQRAGDPPQPVLTEACLGLARICYEWNDLDAAEQHAQQSLQLARQFDKRIDRFILSEVFLARLKLARGDVAGATASLAESEQSVRQNNYVHRMPDVAAAQVVAFLRQGDLPAAARLAETHELPMSRARVLLAQKDASAALAVLEPYRQQMEGRGWADERLKAMILQAVALHANGEEDQAVQQLSNALALAEPAGFVRTFVDEGVPMARLLSAAAGRGVMPGYTGKLLAAFTAEEDRSQDGSRSPAARPAQPLEEPLSQREFEVLRLIAQGLSNQEICQRLFIALSTVKGHNRIIFGKLQVQRRTEAVARARELGLL